MRNGAVGKTPHPPAFEHPDMLRFRPPGTCCEKATAQLEIRWINFKNTNPAEQVWIGVKNIVIVNLVVFAKDPALRMSVRLRRSSLDLVMQGVLPLVRIRKIGIVEQDHRGRQRQSSQKKGHSQAVKTGTACFYRDGFIVLTHHPEGDEHRHQCSQGPKMIEQERRQIAEEVQHEHKRNL